MLATIKRQTDINGDTNPCLKGNAPADMSLKVAGSNLGDLQTYINDYRIKSACNEICVGQLQD